MRVAFISPYFYPVTGGMERHVLEIAKRLCRYGHEVVVYTSDRNRRGKRIEKSSEVLYSFEVRRLHSLTKLFNYCEVFPSIFPEIRKKEKEFDVIHVHGYRHPHSLLPLFVRCVRRKSLITLHFPVYPLSSLPRRAATVLFDRTLGRKVLSSYNRIIALTKVERRWISNSFSIPEERIEVIPNGIPKEMIEIKKIEDETVEKYKDEFLLLSIGRLCPEKGFHEALRAIALLPKSIRKRLKYMIVGEDYGMKRKLFSLARKYDVALILAGKVTDERKIALIDMADVVLIPSLWEGFSLVLLEAMAREKPVIARKIPVFLELHPEREFLFKDSKDLAKKIELFLEGSLKKKKKYQKIVEERYTWDVVVEKLVKVYEEIT
jgi:glycosyltransferase involved in cell wall biosynthesis